MRLGLPQGLAVGGFVPLVSFTNAYSVSFDGTDDHATTGADDTLATKTYSFWAKSTDTSQNGVFNHGSTGKGAFTFNYSAGRPTLHATSVFRYWADNAGQDDGNWHHWLLFIDSSDISGCRLFCDGTELSVAYTHDLGGSMSAYSTGITLGFDASNYFDGNLDEFAIFDGDKTGIVSTLYNDGVPADLTGLSGLEHWWRMGDNDGGTGTTVTDQAGDENAALTNGAAIEEDVPS